jgi:hypothetical protein
MGERDNSFVVFAIAAGLAGGFAVYFLTGWVFTSYAWCIAGEDHCIRNWMGALSGWFGGTAALATVWFLAGQLREARRQTEFVTGDALPSVAFTEQPDIRRDEEAFLNSVTITNWNRNAVVIHMINVDDEWGQAAVEVRVVHEPETYKRQVMQAQFEEERLFLRGWTDRNSPPPSLDFSLAIGRYTTEESDSFARREFVRLAVDLTVLSPTPARTRIIVESPFALVL